VAREYDDYLYATQPAFGLFTLDAFYAVGPHVSEWNLSGWQRAGRPVLGAARIVMESRAGPQGIVG